MTLSELYDALFKHDWYTDWSDDERVRRGGELERVRLHYFAAHLGAEGMHLFDAFSTYNTPYRHALAELPRRPQ